MPGLRFQIFEGPSVVHSVEAPGAAEFGRQAEGEEPPYRHHQDAHRLRVVFARLEEKEVSRKHFSVEPLPDGRVKVLNGSRTAPVAFGDGTLLDPGTSREVIIPVSVLVGGRRIAIESADAEQSGSKLAAMLAEHESPGQLQSLPEATLPPGALARRPAPKPDAAGGMGHEPLIRWLETALTVLQSAGVSTDFYEKAADALVTLVNLDTGQVLRYENGQWRLLAHRSAASAPHGDERAASRNILAQVLREKRTFWHVPATASGASLAGVNALVAAPILNPAGEVIGVLYGDRQSRGVRGGAPPITQLEAMLVQLLAGGVATGLSRLEREEADRAKQKKFVQYERELDIGRNIQVGFLPEALPKPNGWELAAYFKPAREVGGDFYDVFQLSNHQLAINIADVCDKGVGAALFMAIFRTLLRASCQMSLTRQLLGASPDAAAVAPRSTGRRASLLTDLNVLTTVETTNAYVSTTHAASFMFATLFFGILDIETGELVYVNGGHDYPTIINANGIKTRLKTTGPAVGLMTDAVFDIAKVTLEPGDVLVMNTDGVTDARNPAGKGFGEERLLELLKEPAPTAAALVDRLVTALTEHIGTADQFDDITLLVTRRVPVSS